MGVTYKDPLHHICPAYNRTPHLTSVVAPPLPVLPNLPDSLGPHAVVDSGCSTHAFRADAPVALRDSAAPTYTVGTPTGAPMRSSAAALTHHTTLPLAARHAHLFPDITYRSLLSVGQFCDAGYRVLFDDTMVYVLDSKGVALTGHRDPVSRLYLTPLGPFSRPVASPVHPPYPTSPPNQDPRRTAATHTPYETRPTS